jgi:hypothetical protein
MSQPVYKTSPIKRRDRRTRSTLQTIRAALYGTLEEDNPATVRQVFYRLVSAGIIEKTEAEYKNTVCRLLALMRREGALPFGWIADNTRWMRKPRTFSGIEDALKRTAEFYRRALWDEQKKYVEVWLEKDALAGVLYPITSEWDVPLMVTRGYPSLSFLYEAAEQIGGTDKPTFIYYLGDHDPSGVNIPKVVERELREMAPDADITFERLAVNVEQIRRFNLQTRPTKTSDSRSKNFKGESVEVDAIPPAMLRNMVNDAIVRHVNKRALKVLQVAEESERGLLRTFAEHWSEAEG